MIERAEIPERGDRTRMKRAIRQSNERLQGKWTAIDARQAEIAVKREAIAAKRAEAEHYDIPGARELVLRRLDGEERSLESEERRLEDDARRLHLEGMGLEAASRELR